jgi:tripartite-type tricarboxylate transporter receptor subunit TctC
MRKSIGIAAALAVLSTLSGEVIAQTYPSRPITMIVPFAAGGPLDVMGRILGERMRASLGQPVIIETVPGATGSIGVGRVARAAPDGYTISIGNWATHVVNGAIFTLNYDLPGDFEPVVMYSVTQQILLAKKSMPGDDLKGLIAWLKANPDKATQATSGIGSAGHVAAAYFQKATGTSFQFIPYRGLAPAMQALLAGQVDMIIDLPSNSLPHLQAGKVKAYAVLAKDRLAVAPNIPTVDEAGLQGFYAPVWYAIWAPKGTPKDIVAKLNAAVVDALADGTVRQRLTAMGQEIVPRDQQTPEVLGALHKAEVAKWWPIIKAANIRAE